MGMFALIECQVSKQRRSDLSDLLRHVKDQQLEGNISGGLSYLEDHPSTCKWLGSPPFISHLDHLEGEQQPYFEDLLRMVINHLLNGMILQVHPLKFHRAPEKPIVGKLENWKPSLSLWDGNFQRVYVKLSGGVSGS